MSDAPRRPWKPKPPPAPTGPLRTETELLGSIERFVFKNDDSAFRVAKFRIEGESELVGVAGPLGAAAPGEPLRLLGEWKRTPKYGDTFEVRSFVPRVATGKDQILAYLGSGMVKGIGPVYAAKIVDHFGDKAIEILDHAPERLMEVRGLGRTKAQAMSAGWKAYRARHEMMLVLSALGISPTLARRLEKHYGEDAASVLKANPYRASLDVPGIGFLTADRLASELGVAKDSPHRARAGFVHLLESAASEGHTHLPREMLLEKATTLLTLDAAAVERALSEELETGRLLRAEVLPSGRDAIFQRSLYLSESACARLVGKLNAAALPLLKDNVAARLAAFEEKYHFALAAQQREAIHSAVAGGVVVVTGGPGTGKTTLVRALLAVLAGSDKRIALAAPTGRAAQRLGETTHREATTIHRLLKYLPQKGTFQHNSADPLEADLVLVDESSMLDVVLAAQLLEAIPPGATVAFVGDADQLPSVGPGNFLHDLIESGTVRVTRLSVIFRQGRQSAIIVNSHRILAGEMPFQNDDPDDKAPRDFYIVPRDEPEAIQRSLVELVTQRIPQKFGLDPTRDVQVLTPMRRGAMGANEINKLLQATLNAEGRAVGNAPAGLRVGDKVIQNSNNYDLDVFNGDVGIVTTIDREADEVRVLFGKRQVAFPSGELDQVGLAYAVTVHKSQGSEYPAVVVIVHPQHYMMLRRNLLYTAITRGKKLVVVIGAKRAIAMAVRNARGDERFSALGEWLARPPQGDASLV